MRQLGRRYALWIVEEVEAGGGHATMTAAGLETHDADEAWAWAEGFNRAELDRPMGAWAVVRIMRDDAVA